MTHLLGVVHRVVGMYEVIPAVGGKTPFHSSVSIEGGVEDSAVSGRFLTLKPITFSMSQSARLLFLLLEVLRLRRQG